MSKKILIIVAVFVVLLAGVWLFLNFGVRCYDGQGSTMYLPREQLLKNIESTNATEAEKYFIPPTISVGYIAKTKTNSCGKITSRVTVENGAEKNVSQSNFDKFINDYNVGCSNCLMRLSQSGNSPLFIREYPSGPSYILKNNNGTLLLESTNTMKNSDTVQTPNIVERSVGADKAIIIDGVAVNHLVFLASIESPEDIESLVSEFGGKIVVSVPETSTYEVRFPVTSLKEIDIIADKLRKKSGIQVVHAYYYESPKPGEPQ